MITMANDFSSSRVSQNCTLQDKASFCDASLYMTYSKCLKTNGLAGEGTLVKIKETAAQLGVSEDDVILSWLEEMGNLHK